ncbi:hypothetical protein Q9299_01740 [Gemmobacter fulvus]|uniref:hypothetical protein n=1 Tax=Gemmobacter fulvus TaxID=2840474 RepID=UPI002796D28A|nr:hypothetical protein [Gemmobacter fulvus]MDQ1846997.1 hypothetical protein [Gemmobacter fulvus]
MTGRAALGVSLALAPASALACALPPSVILTLPTGYYMAGAAATVALTALIAASTHRLPAFRAHLLWDRPVLLPDTLASYLSFLWLLGLLFLGLTGARDPMHNLLPLVIWVGLWVVLPLATMLLGNLWRGLTPWAGPVRMTRLLLGWQGSIGLARLGYWPATAGLLAFTWFQLISLTPEDPQVLATAIAAYWGLIFVLAVLEGEDWLHQGEFLTVYLTALSRIAPFWVQIDGTRARRYAGLPGAQVLHMPALTPSAGVFLTLGLAALTFDGLMETFFWLALIGENPLEFTGRSAVQGVNTVGLLAVWALTAATILGALALGRAVSRSARPFWTEAGPAMLAFLAIAAGYHAAHYLLTLLTTGQYALAALNDPFFRGDALLGLEPFYVSFGFLTDRTLMQAIWTAQFVLILAAHLLALVLALHLSRRLGHSPALAHLPMTLLMIGYTTLGLWLLSSPRGA